MSLVVLVGGARAGKSALALELAHRWDGGVAFVATAEPRDDEMTARIARHRRERPSGWSTHEEPVALGAVLEAIDAAQLVVLDCLTLWVANVLERGAADDDVIAEASRIADLAAARRPPVVVVTNEVGLGVVPATASGRAYRDVLGAVNAAFASRAERVLLVVAGRVLPLSTLDAAWPA